MKHARIIEKAPTRSGRRFWYMLIAVDNAGAGDMYLMSAVARGLAGHPLSVDPGEKQSAIASLHAWAQRNGWTIQNDPP